MADRRLLAIGSGIASGLEKATSNLQGIMAAKYKMQREQEAFELDKKFKNAAMDKMEFEYGPEAIATKRKVIEQESKKREADLELANLELSEKQKGYELQNRIYESAFNSIKPAIIQEVTRGEAVSPAGQAATTLGAMSGAEPEPEFDLGKLQGAGVTELFGVKVPKNQNITDVSGLTPDKQLQARSLARKIGGVRGMEKTLPSVIALMNEGKSMDDIEDELRFAGQSSEFVGPIREAAQSIYASVSEPIAQRGMDYIDDMLDKGDMEGVKSQLKRAVLAQTDAAERSSLIGKERTVKLLDEIQADLATLKSKGIDTNIIRGTWEQISNKLGSTSDPEVRQLLTKMRLAVMNYRRAMSGVAFPEAETKQYRDVFPDIGKNQGFNAANINALKDVFSGDVDNYYSIMMGEEPYKKLFYKGDPAPEGVAQRDWDAATPEQREEFMRAQYGQ